MKFIPVKDDLEEIDTAVLTDEYKQGHEIGRVSLGPTLLFFKIKSKVYYIPYSAIYRTFRRVKEVRASLCCGKGVIQLQYLVLCSNKAELAEIDLPDERSAVILIEELQQKAPKMKIGKKE